MLGRIHTMEEFVQSYETARAAGFDNINIDLMSALPGQTFESFLHTLDTVLALKPEHISMYSLILEEGTALYEHLDRYPALPDEDTERQMYDTACLRLAVTVITSMKSLILQKKERHAAIIFPTGNAKIISASGQARHPCFANSATPIRTALHFI